MTKSTDASQLASSSRTIPAPAPSVLPPATAAADQRPDLRLVPGTGSRMIAAAGASETFTTLVAALHGAGMADLLAGSGPFTLFAPTDRAFARLPDGVLDALLRDGAWLERVMTGHLVAGRVTSPQPGTPSTAMSVAGSELNITVHNGTFRVNGARIVRPHVRASNGMIRGIDTVLMRH
jgi:uncharacterized surface protein with fasciclin (FAS1) repeats